MSPVEDPVWPSGGSVNAPTSLPFLQVISGPAAEVSTIPPFTPLKLKGDLPLAGSNFGSPASASAGSATSTSDDAARTIASVIFALMGSLQVKGRWGRPNAEK